jgi:hypothetical protein
MPTQDPPGRLLRTWTLVSSGELGLGALWLLARMATLVLALPWLLKLLSLPALLRLLDPGVRALPAPDPAALDHRVRLARRLLSRQRGPFRQSCLRRSLVLFRHLRSSGFPVAILFGISQPSDALDGHAWLELDGSPIAESDGPQLRYRVIYRYPP